MAEHVSKEHLRTAGVVKHVHSELRRKLRSGKPFHEVINTFIIDYSVLVSEIFQDFISKIIKTI